MLEQTVTYNDLSIPLSEIYEAMGYKDSIPDAMVIEEVDALVHRITPLLRPRFFFFFTEGVLDVEKGTLTIQNTEYDTEYDTEQETEQETYSTEQNTVLSIGKTIARQLRESEAFVFFAATAGSEFEAFQHLLQTENDMVKIYIADSIGSVIAEKTADCMERALDVCLEEIKQVRKQVQEKVEGWKHTNRYSPGYCGWHVSEQQKLFSLFPVASPCGIQLTDSSLMTPIKSVSGVIGIGSKVRKLEYTCGLCSYENCFRKRFTTE